ncbi:MAG: phenylacetate-CoA oxygenase subunit PaaJ [Ferruginibacter sp.]|nr:phenylacetate-CoA oxygenase subunit PaaJ [Ferruginibacter sp.]
MIAAQNNKNTENNSIIASEVAIIWKLLEEVYDPELPVLSVLDLGIVRDVQITSPSPGGRSWEGVVMITPTYSGCPAMDTISMGIRLKLIEHGYNNIKVISVLSPAWTTGWMSQAGKDKLKAYGIAPPNSNQTEEDTRLFAEPAAIQCPLCDSFHTKLISRFGSTACKSLYQCHDCKEPFDYFKCH